MTDLVSGAFTAAAFAIVAGFAAIIAAMAGLGAAPSVRPSLRFAAALGGALALVDLLAAVWGDAANAAAATTLLVAALAPAVLALAAYVQYGAPPGTGFTAILLALACLSGLLSAATGAVLLAFTPLLLSAAAFVALAGRLWGDARRTGALLAMAGCGFIAAAAAWMSGQEAGRTGFVLFFAASLLGGTLALARRSDLAFEAAAARGTARGTFFISGED